VGASGQRGSDSLLHKSGFVIEPMSNGGWLAAILDGGYVDEALSILAQRFRHGGDASTVISEAFALAGKTTARLIAQSQASVQRDSYPHWVNPLSAIAVHVEQSSAKAWWLGAAAAFLLRDSEVLARTQPHVVEVTTRSSSGTRATRHLLQSSLDREGARPESVPAWEIATGDQLVLCSESIVRLVEEKNDCSLLKSTEVVPTALVNSAISGESQFGSAAAVAIRW
jgi:hypothetical protein